MLKGSVKFSILTAFQTLIGCLPLGQNLFSERNDLEGSYLYAQAPASVPPPGKLALQR